MLHHDLSWSEEIRDCNNCIQTAFLFSFSRQFFSDFTIQSHHLFSFPFFLSGFFFFFFHQVFIVRVCGRLSDQCHFNTQAHVFHPLLAVYVVSLCHLHQCVFSISYSKIIEIQMNFILRIKFISSKKNIIIIIQFKKSKC